MNKDVEAIILAGGRGRRLGNKLPKVLYRLCGKSLIGWILDDLEKIGIVKPTIVIGTGNLLVKKTFQDRAEFALQPIPLGTGHAVLCAMKNLGENPPNVLVMMGDSPLFRIGTIRKLIIKHQREDPAISFTTTKLDNPFGCGRILRGSSGEILDIIEEKEADSEQKLIDEVNAGLYCFEKQWLKANIKKLSKRSSGEHYLTDIIKLARKQGKKVIALEIDDSSEMKGVNNPEDLKKAEEILGRRNRN